MFTHVPGISFPMFQEFVPPDVHTVLKFISETADRYRDKIKIKHPGGQLKCLQAPPCRAMHTTSTTIDDNKAVLPL
ncbi:hypothetical protein E2C01_090825 [Portunus trituberculatus]|uniref:Uncharacterized protein n=1 Tax=Portunus trituberculatus TaxID=210409 RepID=A0A5B7JR66_PORTR|nr:hypothetical protein [Portunus trituberculatus]